VLTVVPTPIGNLRDITLRALDVLRAADVVACEDTRRTRALLSAHDIPAPRLVVCDERREAQHLDRLVDLARSQRLALVSDAGMPGIADPGRLLVDAALAAGCEVEVLPGPSAVETAVVVSGLAAEGYSFRGWVPRKASERRRALERALAEPLPVVLFESPRRAGATVAALAALAPSQRIALCRELTKLHEEVLRGPAAEVAAALAGRGELRGEVVLVVAGRGGDAPVDEASRATALAAARRLAAQGMGARDAAALVSGLTGVDRRELYRAASSARQVAQTGRP
jgi:16S rRNA (cytidine1402-2'-O)-methyltransferase